MMKKWLVSLLAAALLVSLFAGTSVSAQTQFNDTNHTEIQRLADDGVVRGIGSNMFGPKQDVTRAEVAVIMGRALDISVPKASAPFSDTRGHWAEAAIAEMAERGYVNGYKDGTYQPNRTLTRQEMAAILTRAFNYQSERSAFFTDVPPTHYYYGNIQQLAQSGIANGYPDGTFGADQTINREEFALMIARTLYPEYRPEVDSVDLDGEMATAKVVNVPSGDTLNVRPDGSTDHSPIGTLKQGENVKVHDISGNWAMISNSGVRGYVNTYYLDITYPQGSGGSLSGRTIMIDAGHGGSDPGAVANGLREKDINLDVSLRLERKLKDAGANVLMTRRSDVFPSLRDRVNMANNAMPDIFISVHANAATPAAKGIETFYDTRYWAGDSKKLADDLQSSMLRELGSTNRGVKTAGFYVIKNTKVPSALVELGFLTNSQEAARMRTSSFRESAADSLYKGIVSYYR
ncbi:N-acetylmuramoyl-L-alanine amidase [Alkalicoccus urumqiensis]|nr:N-acetylmuramoyl-L-alanine amidase [Alkalicoccus urumqiensis]